MSGNREDQERMARQAMTTIPLKTRLSALFLFVCVTAATVFIFTVAGSELVDILHKKDVVYYDWKTLPLFLWLPAFFYADILVAAMMFFPITRNLLEYLLTGMRAIAVYGWLMLFLSIPLSLIILYYPLGNYESCGQNGPFSGTDYVKDPKMCEQFEYHPEKDISND
ncbi:hypothetical protein [Citrobacter enshiensis]|uniref:hypothetical protein n=1 Tax=Citrobacter enshiensis TaxID=2971264 RepID=UPI0023E787EE|nr:hypothetical protein [Citrobacter enshiensis]WET42299.1 hypothetical protein P2W74_09170 [Citrobacter enshiensis]